MAEEEEKKDGIPSPNDKVEADESKGEAKVSISVDEADKDVLADSDVGVAPTMEVKKDPKAEQDNISSDSPRFKQVYGQLKAQQRENSEILKRLGEKDKLFEAAQEHQKELTAAILKIEAGRDAREDKKEQSTVLDNLNSTAKRLKGEIAEAYEEGKVAEALLLNDQLVDTKVAISAAKAVPKVEPKVDKSEVTQAQTTPENDKAVAALQANHDWFGKNKEMTAMAGALDDAFKVDPAYKDVPLAERYEEVAELVEERFGMEKEEKKPEPKPSRFAVADVEEGSDGFSKGTSTRDVVLTADQRSIASSMGISETDYAKQIYMINSQKGK